MTAISRVALVSAPGVQQVPFVDYLRHSHAGYGNNDPTVGYDIPTREHVTNTNGNPSGAMFISYFTSYLSFSATNIGFAVSTAKAGGTTSIVRLAIYTIDTDNKTLLTELANTVNDTTLIDSTGLKSVALSTTVNFVRGTRYAIGLLCVASVGWTTDPSFRGVSLNAIPTAVDPVMAMRKNGNVNLPTLPTTPATTTGNFNAYRFT